MRRNRPLRGGSGRDIFVLAERGEIFYDDRGNNTSGTSDYALIEDFSSGRDKIQLSYQADLYSIGSAPKGLPSGAGIFYANSPYDNPELIGVVANVSPSELSLTNTSQFLYA